MELKPDLESLTKVWSNAVKTKDASENSIMDYIVYPLDQFLATISILIKKFNKTDIKVISEFYAEDKVKKHKVFLKPLENDNNANRIYIGVSNTSRNNCIAIKNYITFNWLLPPEFPLEEKLEPLERKQGNKHYIVSNATFSRYPYIEEFIRFLTDYRIENDVKEIGSEEMATAMAEFIQMRYKKKNSK